MPNWFSHCYRRNLVDMHIEDWSDEFLSKFSPEIYVDNLKKAHIQAPMIYLQSHVGHCYFPTKVGHMHRAFEKDPSKMKRLVDLCHDNGMKVVGYYSLIYNTVEEDKHPEWRIVTGEDGTSAHQRGGRYGHCCPNNPEYRTFIKAQIQEMADCFTLDGMFYDMTFWPGVCRCSYCTEQYRKAGITDIKAACASDDWKKLMMLRVNTIGDFAKFVTDATREAMPGITIEHNYANAVAANDIYCGSSELVNDQCDYTGGDLYGDLYNHSFTAKYYYAVTKNQPFEYMTCRCDRSLRAHTVTKTEEHLATEVMLTAANHGASFVIDAIDPVGTMDSRVYERIGRVFERQMPYEKYFSGDMVNDVKVYYSTMGRYNSRLLPFTNKTCSVNATRALIESHIPVGVVSNATTDKLSGCPLVVAPNIAGIYQKNRDELAQYVADGGHLYISGVEDMPLLKMLLGAEFKGYTPETAVYMAPTAKGQPYFGEFTPDYPLPTEYSLPIVEVADAEVYAVMKLPYTAANERRFASIHSNPPGILTEIPALLVKSYGKGKVMWSAAPIENDDRLSHKRLFCELVKIFVGKPSVVTTAPRQVELVTFARENDMLISGVDLLCTDELLPIRKFTLSVKVPKPVTRVIRLAGRDTVDTDIPFTYADGYVTFTVDGLVMFDMYRMTY